jgi:PKD repeat protein
VIGVVLLLGVVVVTTTTAGVLVLTDLPGASDTPTADVRGAVTAGGITLVHNGGDDLQSEDIRLVVTVNGSRQPVEWADGNLTGSDPSRFQPGEGWVNDSLAFDDRAVVDLKVFDGSSGTLLFETRQHPHESPLALDTEAPTPAPATPRPNQPPTGMLSANETALQTGEPVRFADESTDTDGTIASSEWDVDDDGAVDGNGPTVTTTYSDDGTYTVSLTVTDDDGANATATTTVTVANRPPVAAAQVEPTSAVVGEPIRFTNASFDHDGTIETVEWQFDDGESSTAADPTHAYDAEGSYNATIEVTDDDGATSTDTVQVQIEENEPPTVDISESMFIMSWNEFLFGRTVELSAERSEDPDGPDSALDYEWSIVDDSGLGDDVQLQPRNGRDVELRLVDGPPTAFSLVTIEVAVTDEGGITTTEETVIIVWPL